MPEPETSTPQGEVHLFGRRVPQDTERKFLLIAGAAGIAGLALILIQRARANAASAGASSPAASGSASGGTSGGSGGDGSTTPPASGLIDVVFGFSESTSPTIEYQKGSSKSGGGGLSIGTGGFSLGIGGSGSSVSGLTTGLNVDNKFATSVSYHGDANGFNSILTAIEGLAGTQQERADQAQHELDQLAPYALGHSIADIHAQDAAAQRLRDAQTQQRIDRLNPPPRHNAPVRPRPIGRVA